MQPLQAAMFRARSCNTYSKKIIPIIHKETEPQLVQIVVQQPVPVKVPNRAAGTWEAGFALHSLSMKRIVAFVSNQTGISIREILGGRRQTEVVRARMIAQWLCRELTDHGYPTLGRFFHKDHTSIMHAVRKIDRLKAADVEFAGKLAWYCGELTGSAVMAIEPSQGWDGSIA